MIPITQRYCEGCPEKYSEDGKIRCRKYPGRILLDEISALEKQIEDSEYDEPVECLGCGWKGLESQLIEVDQCDEYGPLLPSEACPSCRSVCFEYIEE